MQGAALHAPAMQFPNRLAWFEARARSTTLAWRGSQTGRGGAQASRSHTKSMISRKKAGKRELPGFLGDVWRVAEAKPA
jgi:hypothetical protein